MEEAKMRVKHFLPAVMMLLLAGGVVFGAYGVGDHVGDWTKPDAFGQDHTLYDYEGMVIVLNFWESW